MTEPVAVDPNKVLAVVRAGAREARPSMEPEVSLDSSLEKELGLDSLARVELVLRLEREFAASLPEQALATSETPRDLLRFLLASAGHAPQAADRSVASLVQGEGVRAPSETQARTLTEALAYHVERQPERLTVFMYEGEHEFPLSYRALWDGAMGYAAALTRAGLQRGQMVAIMLPTCKEYLYSFYGVLLAGGVPVPLYPPARLTTIEDHMTRHVSILQSAGAAIMITVPEAKALAYLLRAQVESLRQVLVPADLSGAAEPGFEPVHGKPGDMGFLQYTSGSTGMPKGVVLSHANLMANVRAMGAAVDASPADVFVSWLPLYHDLGLIGANFASLVLGFPTVLMSPLAFLSRPVSWMRAIHRHGGTLSGGPNFSFELCLRRIADEDMEGIDLSTWRFAFNAAEPVSPDTIVEFEKRFARWGLRKNCLSPSYGLAESSVGVAITVPGTPWIADRLDRERFTRTGEAVEAGAGDPSPLVVIGCGTPIPGHDIRVVDAAGLELADRQEGLLQFRGPSSTSGYYRNPEATKKLFAGEWVNTGDRAYLSQGTLFLTGREKDIIIRGGRNISPYELEQAVGDLGGVRRGCVAVFGSRDAASGTERMVVLAEMRNTDATRHDDLRHMINELAVNLTGGPADDIVLAPPGTVPKTSSGKIRRVAARAFYERGPSSVKSQAVWLQFARPRAARRAVRAARLSRLRRAVPGGARHRRARPAGRHVARGRRGLPAVPARRGHPARGARRRADSAGGRGAGREPHQLSRRRGAARGARAAPVLVRRQARVRGQPADAHAAQGLRHAVRRAIRRAKKRRACRRAGGRRARRRVAGGVPGRHADAQYRADGLSRGRFSGRHASGSAGGARGATRRALGAARRYLVRAARAGGGDAERAHRAGGRGLVGDGAAARPRARRDPQALRRARPGARAARRRAYAGLSARSKNASSARTLETSP